MNYSIETERLFTKPLTLKYASFITELLNTEGWLRFIGEKNVKDEPAAAAYIQKIMDNPTCHYWVVHEKLSNNPIGIITLIQRDFLDNVDFGFAFLPQFFNKGYAYESSKAVLDSLLASKLYAFVLAIVLPENLSSIKLIEKLNFKFEKENIESDEVLLQYKLNLTT